MTYSVHVLLEPRLENIFIFSENLLDIIVQLLVEAYLAPLGLMFLARNFKFSNFTVLRGLVAAGFAFDILALDSDAELRWSIWRRHLALRLQTLIIFLLLCQIILPRGLSTHHLLPTHQVTLLLERGRRASPHPILNLILPSLLLRGPFALSLANA